MCKACDKLLGYWYSADLRPSKSTCTCVRHGIELYQCKQGPVYVDKQGSDMASKQSNSGKDEDKTNVDDESVLRIC